MKAVNENVQERTSVRWKLVIRSFAASVIVGFLILYQAQAKAAWMELPSITSGDVAETQARLTAVTELMEKYPVWYGSGEGRRERSRLNTDLVQLKTDLAIATAEEEGQSALNRLEAINTRERAVGFLLEENLPEARASLIYALKVAPSDWAEREQVRLDIEAINEELEVNR